MSKIVSISDAKAQFSTLVSRAESGEKITITRGGRIVAELRPLTSASNIREIEAPVVSSPDANDVEQAKELDEHD